jgi:hypothetical protein
MMLNPVARSPRSPPRWPSHINASSKHNFEGSTSQLAPIHIPCVFSYTNQNRVRIVKPMPIQEADPWRLQYFKNAACPPDVNIPTDDEHAWMWYPKHRWIYDKVAVALSQGLDAAPHGVPPPGFPVFSKPIINLRGMGAGSRVIRSMEEYGRVLTPGHMWMTMLEGRHISSPRHRSAGARGNIRLLDRPRRA